MVKVGCGEPDCVYCKHYIEQLLNDSPGTHYFEPGERLDKASGAKRHVDQLFGALPKHPTGPELHNLSKAIQNVPCPGTGSKYMKKFISKVKTLAKKGGYYEKRGYGDNRGKVTTQYFSGLKSMYTNSGGLGAPVGTVYMLGANGKNFNAPLSGLVFNDCNDRVSVKRSTHKANSRQQRRVTDEGRRRSQRVQQHAKARGLPTDRSK